MADKVLECKMDNGKGLNSQENDLNCTFQEVCWHESESFYCI
jgi:hypothetical protein